MSRKGSSKELGDQRNESGGDLSQTPSMQKVDCLVYLCRSIVKYLKQNSGEIS